MKHKIYDVMPVTVCQY